MSVEHKLTVLGCGNGDSILIEAHGYRILTDINYCEDPKDGRPDIAEAIRSACPKDVLDVFVVTHPDQDHCRGFDGVFHTGGPDTWDSDPEEGPVKILVHEIWCSPYGAEPNYTTDASEALVKEIRRRKALLGTAAALTNGNRLRVLDTDGTPNGTIGQSISWRVLAPTPGEADIPEGDDPDCPPSSNSSSLVIQWTVGVDGKENLILIGGDAPVEVWERLHKDKKDTPGELSWHVLVAPHHCSRYVLGRKDLETEEFSKSPDAVDALSGQLGSGFVVASSKAIQNDDDDPPSHQAMQIYLGILASGGQVTDAVKSRFRCTGSENGGSPDHVIFYLTSAGPSRIRGGSSSSGAGTTSVGGGGSYG